MKKLAFTFLVLAIALSAKGQEKQISDKFALGFQICQYQKDFGIGINMTSPYFADGHMAFRLRGNLMYLEHLTVSEKDKEKEAETVWTPYGNASFSFVGSSQIISNFLRLYGEGGVICLFPSGEFSSDSYAMGGFGLFGFEFYMSSKHNYFIELGGMGTGAKADKVQTQPIYSNGFIINTGFRLHFKN